MTPSRAVVTLTSTVLDHALDGGLPPGAIPIDPAIAGPRSDRMSPKRLLPTTTSNQSGCWTKWPVRMSTLRYCMNGVALRFARE